MAKRYHEQEVVAMLKKQVEALQQENEMLSVKLMAAGSGEKPERNS